MSRFFISNKDWNKIIGYAKIAHDEHKSEIGGMAIAMPDKEGDWVVLNPIILKQTVSSGNCVLDKDALAQHYVETAKKHNNPDLQFVWWHSHHTMSAFWSGTDLTAIEEYSGGKFSMSLVVNLKEEYKFRVSVWDPIEVHQDVKLERFSDWIIEEEMKQEVKVLCDTVIKDVVTSNYVNTFYSGKANGRARQQYLLNDNIGEKGDWPGNDRYDTVKIVENLNSRYVDGSMKHSEWKNAIKTQNKRLQEMKSC